MADSSPGNEAILFEKVRLAAKEAILTLNLDLNLI